MHKYPLGQEFLKISLYNFKARISKTGNERIASLFSDGLLQKIFSSVDDNSRRLLNPYFVVVTVLSIGVEKTRFPVFKKLIGHEFNQYLQDNILSS